MWRRTDQPNARRAVANPGNVGINFSPRQLATFTSVAIFQVKKSKALLPMFGPSYAAVLTWHTTPLPLSSFFLLIVFKTGALFDTEKDNRLYFIVEGECRLCLLDEEEDAQDQAEPQGVVVEPQIDKQVSGPPFSLSDLLPSPPKNWC